MKKILLTIAFFAGISVGSKLLAQCTLSNITVNLNSATPTVGGDCLVNMNIAFDMTNNNGNKYIWINLWKSTDYAFTTFNYGAGGAKAPSLDELDGADNTHDPVAVIGINNDVVPVVYLTSYPADPTNITPTTGTSISKTVGATTSTFVLTNVTFLVPGGCAGLILQGDVWSSQSNSSNSPIHCFSEGISFFGDPTINGLIFCNRPRSAQVNLTTVSTAPITVNYTVYIDNGVVGVKEPGDPVAIATTANFALSSGSPYNSGPLAYIGNNVLGVADKPLLIELNVVSPFSKTIYGNLINSCIPLPVDFKSFTATRSNANVMVKWETSTEVNNSGFAVERNVNGTWMQVAFVPSQATNGNSNSLLTYTFNDLNSTKGVSQYRIKQIDIDAQFKYSEIRSVRGDGQAGKIIVYPNPSSDGKVNVVFEDAKETREVSVIDMSGRIVKQFRNVTNNNISIENLTPGIYSLRVFVPATGEQAVQKIVVNK